MEALYETMRSMDFRGASGRVSFNENGDRRGMQIRIENIQNGVEHQVGTHDPLNNGSIVLNTSAIVWSSGNRGDVHAPTDGSEVFLESPVVHSVHPSVISPSGGRISIVGSSFRAGIITVSVDGKLCIQPTFKSVTLIECDVPAGMGGPHQVVVSCDGIPSDPRRLLSYFLPHITQLSKSWIADGSRLRVTGSNFILGSTRCRAKGYSEDAMGWLAKVFNDSHIECHIRFPGKVNRDGGVEKLEVSNDGGQRWVSGLTMNTPIVWGGGALVPVSPHTQVFPKEVVVGGIIPTDMFADPETAKQFVSDLTLSFNMAAQTVNDANLFPGNIQLRVEILLVDPGGSGSPTTVTEVATAFAKQGVAVNASTNVGVHDSSKCIEFGHPIEGRWQGDPECCSIHAKAGCSGGYAKVKGDVCGSGSWGVAHETKCESTRNPHPLTNVIGIVGPYWSSNAIPAARAVSTPFRLPMIGVDPWTSVLDNATEFPFFIRVGPANSDMSRVCGTFMRSMKWNSIAVVTDDDAFTSDYGIQVATDMQENGRAVIYHGIFPTLPTHTAVNKQGQLHLDCVKNISSHLRRAREKGARVVFVMAKGDATRIALYSALYDSGFLGKGFGVMDGNILKLSTDLIASGNQMVTGIVHMTLSRGTQECRAAYKCPHKACGSKCAAKENEMNQAYDAVFTLASAIAPMFRDGGGLSYLLGEAGTREAAMAAIHATSLTSDDTASGLLEFTGPHSTTRNKWNFGCV